MKNALHSKLETDTLDSRFLIYKKIIIGFFTTALLVALFIFGQTANADNTNPAEQDKARNFIETFANRAIQILNNKELSEDQAFQEYRTILNEGFALDYIAKISLSRHRNKASNQELDEYYRLFPEFLLKVNSARLKKLDTTKVVIDKVTPHGDKSDIFIRTKIFNSQNKAYDVDWRVRSDNNGVVKIIDVKIEGISLVATQRDDFTSRITSSGVGGLNQYMKDIIDGTVIAQNDES
ncbi:MAG: ABC transporter substrate-binding protein [Proteobacteria bacterium]|jgi:phospholipid transport system substrate-binding protein|nr:ABC transporter substrate-binding protein [Pseudomonadota bacterium]